MRKVAVVGGGLAGLAAALVLAQSDDVEVTLYEASDRLGGKAGASLVDEHFEDHGYHIFPPWYLNLYAIIDHLGISDNLKDITSFHQLQKGDFPNFKTLVNFTSFRFAWKNLWSSSIPFWDLALYYYSVVDLICQPYSRRAFLDQISVNGFVRSRFYRTEAIAKQYQELLLKFISVPSYKVSAMTVKIMLNYWVADGVPMHRILVGDMHTTFIQPWEERLRRLGCKIVTSTRLTKLQVERGRITGLDLLDVKTDRVRSEPVDEVVIAMPPRDVTRLFGNDIHEAAPKLYELNYLNAEAMAGLSIYLDRNVEGLPAEHINLIGSKYALTLIDVSQHWTGFEHTVLNIIASNVTELEGVSDEYATDKIIQELKRFLPFLEKAAVIKSHYQSHFAEPLVMNEVGAWKFRPRAQSEIPNLYLAGAHCRHHVDMTSMEGATVTGIAAANALLKANNLGSGWAVQTPDGVRHWLFKLLRVLALPFAAFAKGWLVVRGWLFGN